MSPVDPTTTAAGMALVAEVETFPSERYPAGAAYYTRFVAEILALYEGENPLAHRLRRSRSPPRTAPGRVEPRHRRQHARRGAPADADRRHADPVAHRRADHRHRLGYVRAAEDAGLPASRSWRCRRASSSWRSRTRSRCCRSRDRARRPGCAPVPPARAAGLPVSVDPTGLDAVAPALLLTTGRHRPHAVAGRPDVVVRCWLDRLRWPASLPAAPAASLLPLVGAVLAGDRSARARLRPRAAGRQPGRGAGDEEPPGRHHPTVERATLRAGRSAHAPGARTSVATRCRRAPQQASVVIPSGLARGCPAPRRACPEVTS